MVFGEAMAASSVAKKVAKSGGLGAGTTALVGAGLVGGGLSFIGTIPEGFVGLRRYRGALRADKDEMVNGIYPRLEGELYGFARKGWHWSTPFTEKWEVVSTQDRNSVLPNFQVISKAGQMYDISGQLKWGIVREKDEQGKAIDYGTEYPELIYRAVIRARDIEELRDCIVGESSDVLRGALNGNEPPDQMETSTLLGSLTRESELGRHLLEEYGCEVRGLSLPGRSLHWADRLSGGMPPAHRGLLGAAATNVVELGQIGGAVSEVG